MKALISTIEPLESGYRVVQVEPDDAIFVVAEGLFWIDCPNDLEPSVVWYDPQDGQFKPIPVSPIQAAPNQPSVQGAQTI
jgi:hypothetical protein